MIIIFSFLLATAVSMAVYATWRQTAAENDPMSARLRQIRAQHTAGPRIGYGDRPPIILDFIAKLGGFLPAREGKNALRTGLVRAGFRAPQAVMVFLGTKLLLACLLPLPWIRVP